METESISVEPDLPVVYPDVDDDNDDDDGGGGGGAGAGADADADVGDTNIIGLVNQPENTSAFTKDEAIKITNIQSSNQDFDFDMNKIEPEKIVVKMEPPDEPVNFDDDDNAAAAAAAGDGEDKIMDNVINNDSNNNTNNNDDDDDDDNDMMNNDKDNNLEANNHNVGGDDGGIDDIDDIDDDDDDDDINIPGIATYDSMSQEEIFNEFQSEEIMDITKIKIENELIIEDDHQISYDEKINYPQFKNRYNNLNVRNNNNNNNNNRYGNDLNAYGNKAAIPNNTITSINRRQNVEAKNYSEHRIQNHPSNRTISSNGIRYHNNNNNNNPYFIENNEEDIDEDYDDDYYDDDFDEDFNNDGVRDVDKSTTATTTTTNSLQNDKYNMEISKYNNFYSPQTVSNLVKRNYNNNNNHHSNSYVHGRFKCKYCVLMFNDTLSMEQHIDNHLEAISDRNSMIERINRIDNISFICRLCKRTYDSISEILKHKRTTCIANRIPIKSMFRTPPTRPPILSMGNQQQQHQQYYQQQQHQQHQQQQRHQQWQLQQQRARQQQQQQLSQQYHQQQQQRSRQPPPQQQQQHRQQQFQQMQRFQHQQTRKNPNSTLLKPISRQPQLQPTFIKPSMVTTGSSTSTIMRQQQQQQKSKESSSFQEVTKIEKDIDNMGENGVVDVNDADDHHHHPDDDDDDDDDGGGDDDDGRMVEHENDGNDDLTTMADDDGDGDGDGDPSIIKPSRIVAYKCTNCNENYTENLYKCIQCAISFYRIPVFKTHLNIHSGESPYKCEICSKTFNRSTTLKSHLNTHSDDKTHVCFQSPQNINNNLIGFTMENDNNENENDMMNVTLDTGKNTTLNKCEENIQTDCITISNFDEKPDRKPIRCRMCTGIFDDIHSYNQHYMRIHRDVKYQRPISMGDFTTSSGTTQQDYKLKSNNNNNNLLMPVAISSPVAVNNINMSSSSTFTSATHQSSTNDFHQGNTNNYNRFPFTCNLCNKRFTNDTLLELHKYRSHNTSRNPLQCKLCDKSFSQLCNYKAHMNIHNDVRPYKCQKCMESFHQQSNLNYHIQTVHINTYRYPCKICTRIFFKMDDLIQHRRRMHFNAPPLMAGRSGVISSGKPGPMGTTIRGVPQNHQQIRIKSEFKNTENLTLIHGGSNNEVATTTTTTTTTGNNVDIERKPEFKCTGCNKEYFHASSLRKHRKQYCGLVPFTCPRCSAEFQTQQEFIVHLATHKDHKPYKCTGCFKAFQFEINLTTHACPAANNTNSSSSSNSNNNIMSTTPTTEITTTAITETIGIPSPSITSTSPADRKQSHSCDICGKEVTTSSSLKKHMLIHTGIKPFACHICEKRFGRNDHLRSHLQSHERGTISAQNVRQCRSSLILDQSINQQTLMKNSIEIIPIGMINESKSTEKLMVNDNLAKLEMMTATATGTGNAATATATITTNIDTNEADREIDEIIKTMKKSSESEQLSTTDDDIMLPVTIEPEITLDDISADTINESLLSSSTVTPTPATVTTTATSLSSSSSTAVNNITGNNARINNLVQITRSNYSRDKDKYGRPLRKPFKCRVCTKSFAKIYSLKYHMNTHTKQKPYECAQCSKIYFQLPSFKAHVKTHMDVKPFTCEYCDKTFTQMCTLKNHVTIHTGERPYQCNECPRAFSQIANLNSHKKTHGYKCKLCLVVVHKINQYRNHMRMHHNIDDYKLEYQQRI